MNACRPANAAIHLEAGAVFSFGLLHGMGFAGVLRELGLPRSQFLAALLTFNAGVEAGQLAVIAVAFSAVADSVPLAGTEVYATGLAVSFPP